MSMSGFNRFPLSLLLLLLLLLLNNTHNVCAAEETARNGWAGFCPVSVGEGEGESKRARTISRVGFGTYRVGHRGEHYEALRTAVRGGINLIDTSANYEDGAAEEAIGRVLKELMQGEGEGGVALNRDDVTIVSKFGFVQSGFNMSQYAYYPDCDVHCLHPQFMRDQLSISLQRLGIDRLDVLLLHNPEFFLSHVTWPHSNDLHDKKAQLETRIYAAFVALEEEAQKTGRIRSYGISSNAYSLPETDPYFLPYQHLLDMAANAAAEVSGVPNTPHHFSTIQLPGNLLEREGVEHCAEWASERGVAVLVNRPLDAFSSDGGAVRLADYPGFTDTYNAVFRQAMESPSAELPEIVRSIDRQIPTIQNLHAWAPFSESEARPALQRVYHDHDARALGEQYLEECYFQVRHQNGQGAREALAQDGVHVPQDVKLQEFALRYLLDNPSVTSVLLGARTPEYAHEAIRLNQQYPPNRSVRLEG